MSAHEVAVFWDFENCAPPNHHSGVEIVNLLRDVLLDRGQIYQFRAYMSLSETTPSARTIALRSELQLSGVSLIDVPHIGRKNAVDLMMIDMMTFCMDHKRHSTIVLLTGDCDFAYPISTIRHRGFQVILISPRGENTHPSLRLQVNEIFSWQNFLPNQPVGPAALESLKCPSAHKCSNSELGPPTTSLLSPLSAGTPSQFEPSVVVTASSVVQSQVDLPEQPEAQTPPDSVAIIDEFEQSRTLSDYQDTSSIPSTTPTKNIHQDQESAKYSDEHLPASPVQIFTSAVVRQPEILARFGFPPRISSLERFVPLIIDLRQKSREGNIRPLHSQFANDFTTRYPFVYRNANVSDWTEYSQLAQESGLIVLGDSGTDTAWVAVTDQLDRILDVFGPLLDVLSHKRVQNDFQPGQSIVEQAVMLAGSSMAVYSVPGVDTFDAYSKLAEDIGVVVRGQVDEHTWLSLNIVGIQKDRQPALLDVKERQLPHSHSPSVQSTPTHCLWIGVIPPETTEAVISSVFGPYGAIESVRVLSNASCAFVNFINLQDAVGAKEALDGRYVLDSALGPMRIAFAKISALDGQPAAANSDASQSLSFTPVSLLSMTAAQLTVESGRTSPLAPLPTKNRTEPFPWYFKPLLEELKRYQGNTKPHRSIIADSLRAKHPYIFRDAGARGWSEYADMAKKLGLIVLGGATRTGAEPWVSLSANLPKDITFSSSQTAPQTRSVQNTSKRASHKLLIEVLRRLRGDGIRKPLRFQIGGALSSSIQQIYSAFQTKSFGEYLEIAQKDGIVLLGGEGSDSWVSLRVD